MDDDHRHDSIIVKAIDLFFNIISQESISNLQRIHKDGNHKNKQYSWGLNDKNKNPNSTILRSIVCEKENFVIVLISYSILVGFVLHNIICLLHYLFECMHQIIFFRIYFHVTWFLSRIWGFNYILVFILILCFPRNLGYILGFCIRGYMNRTLKYTGSFDIHMSWVEIHLNLAELSIEIHNFVWRNHPYFHQTPFFIHIHKATLKMNPYSVLGYMVNKKTILKIHEFVIDRAEVFVERSNIDSNLFNVWHNLGLNGESKSSIKEMLTNFFINMFDTKTILSGGLATTSLMKATDKMSDTGKKVIENMNSKFSKFESGSELNNPITSQEINISSKEQINLASNSFTTISSSSSNECLQNNSKTTIINPKEGWPLIDLNRFVIYRFTAHVGDFITSKHVPPNSSSDLRVEQFIANRENFTNETKQLGFNLGLNKSYESKVNENKEDENVDYGHLEDDYNEDVEVGDFKGFIQTLYAFFVDYFSKNKDKKAFNKQLKKRERTVFDNIDDYWGKRENNRVAVPFREFVDKLGNAFLMALSYENVDKMAVLFAARALKSNAKIELEKLATKANTSAEKFSINTTDKVEKLATNANTSAEKFSINTTDKLERLVSKASSSITQLFFK